MKKLPILSSAVSLVFIVSWVLNSTHGDSAVLSAAEPPAAADTPADSEAQPAAGPQQNTGTGSTEGPATSRKGKPKPGDPAAGGEPGEADAAAKADPRAEEALREAREKLLACRSIKTSLRETVALGERRFRAEGSYLQGSNLKLRLDFKVQVGSTEGSLLEVCDGGVLWTRHRSGETSSITRRDVRQILRAANGKIASNVLVAEMGLGGLPALLASLDDAMLFTGYREEDIDGRAFTMIEGSWQPEFLEQLKSGNKENRLPQHVPDVVRIWFDRETLFPRRIMYLRSPEGRHRSRPMITLDFLDVVLNAPVDDDEFYFVPPDGVVPRDVTNEYLQRLSQVKATPESKPGQKPGTATPPAAKPGN